MDAIKDVINMIEAINAKQAARPRAQVFPTWKVTEAERGALQKAAKADKR